MKIKKWLRRILTLAGIPLFAGFVVAANIKTAKADTPTPIFQESFDSLDKVIANGATSYDNLTFEPGKIGNGVRFSANSNLIYPPSGRLNFQKGTIEFWFKPDWNGYNDLGGAHQPQHFLTLTEGSDYYTAPMSLEIPINSHHDSSITPHDYIQNILQPSFGYQGQRVRFAQSQEGFPYTMVGSWKANTWHRIQVFWDFSIPDNADGTHASYIIAKIDGSYTKFKTVAPTGNDPYTSDAKLMVGQFLNKLYPPKGVMDELKIWDHSLLPVVPFPAFQFSPDDTASVANFMKLFANDGFCSSFENYNNAPSDCPKLAESINTGQNLLFFQKPLLEQVFENTVPAQSEIKSSMDYQQAQGEFTDLFFNVYSRVDLTMVIVRMSDFISPTSTRPIPKENFDLRVVKNWFQAGVGTSADQLPRYEPELMLYNDQVDYQSDPTLNAYSWNAPSIPRQDYVTTKIDQYTSKQFVVISHVPEGTPAGTYTSTVTLTADGQPDMTLKLNLKVLPFSLMDDGIERPLIWYPPIYMVRQIYTVEDFDYWHKIYFQDIKNHGFNCLDISELPNDQSWYGKLGLSLTDLIGKRLKIMQELGFKSAMLTKYNNPAYYCEITPALGDVMRMYGFEPWLTGPDEMSDTQPCLSFIKAFSPPPYYPQTTFEYHILESIYTHNIGGKIMSPGGSPALMDRLSNPLDPVYDPCSVVPGFDPAIGELADGSANYYTGTAGGNAAYFFDLAAGKIPKPNRKLFYIWRASTEVPWISRSLTGYTASTGGVDGPWPASPIFQSGFLYNDFKLKGTKNWIRPDMFVYPSQQGPVPTMEWEAMREGSNDSRYLATWTYYKNLVAETNSALARQSEAVVNPIINRYKDTTPTWYIAGFRNSAAQYETDRQTIAAEIVKLVASLNRKQNGGFQTKSGVKIVKER
jgi:hypothetical protein